MNLNYISSEEMRKLYAIAAQVVAQHGDAYLPIFKRLHEEMQKTEQDFGLKSLALKIALE